MIWRFSCCIQLRESVLYSEDSWSSLEEGFRAGHVANDATCLHYCHHLWSSFHKKPFSDAITQDCSDLDVNMAYLLALNAIGNTYNGFGETIPPEDVISVSWLTN